ncbi:zinc finger FYVE domain-containing protein 1-like [Ischnura elegans]|uniref:zinc finger FYVE domain-containing protein 1-like n=1 Tax=Ischnura elegans TaxID=197161 RepID=UPI001ED87627|nr:zinc finger FYVE domain-containing protein 1-like [Ischnura elegans]
MDIPFNGAQSSFWGPSSPTSSVNSWVNRSHDLHEDPPAIMESIDSIALHHNGYTNDIHSDGSYVSQPSSLPDVTLNANMVNLTLETKSEGPDDRSFHLLDEKESLKVSCAEKFISRLKCDSSTRVKVVSIFGNTGDGKSHTLNHTFFGGNDVFSTSSAQDSCTIGVWAAFDPVLKVIVLDTEGLLGCTSHEIRRTRLLLKVLAVSDLIIYRTRAERLHNDLFTFLGEASRAYSQHFQSALQAIGSRVDFGGPLSALGPAVILFHETNHTSPLKSTPTESPEDVIRSRFAQLKLEFEAFSSLSYLGVQTVSPPTDFSQLRSSVYEVLKNSSVRSPRHPQVVYHTLKVLNEKFNGEIKDSAPVLFSDEYFTCPSKCLSCGYRCQGSMGHLRDGQPHSCDVLCSYQHQYDNCVYICKSCHSNGREVVVLPKTSSSSDTSWYGLAMYAWSGYVLECSHCGVIYRSRQYWYGNKNPEDAAVRTEIRHVWPGSAIAARGAQNAAQKVLDGVTYISEAVASVSSPPTRIVSSWVADQIAPKYWRPNHEIKECCVCKRGFDSGDTKHHCRSCGEGVCADCSANAMPVPKWGWKSPVRVCDLCFKQDAETTVADDSGQVDEAEVLVRKCGEAVASTLSTVASVLDIPRGLIKDSARPSYWVPDSEIKGCCVCGHEFGPRLALHHCRDCGEGVCDGCSRGRRAVCRRGWDAPVRVCDLCMKQD